METIFESPEAKFRFDAQDKIFFFTWYGEVGLETTEKMMTLAAEKAREIDSTHWLADRRELQGYTGEARIWIKNQFVNSVGIGLIKKIDKIAVLGSNNVMAQLSSQVLAKAIAEKNNNIESKQFDHPAPAINWLKGIEVEEKKKSSFFSRSK